MTAASFSERVLAWYDRHGRKSLPWQRPATPYRVWVSEIMLQQTQVATVIPYFERFVAHFPGVRALASARLDDVLQHWAGLGYYARARNLHLAACILRDSHAGEFPSDIEAIASLPGIGRSTAGAILALSRDRPHAILDGNVKRVLARHRGVEGWPGTSHNTRHLWRIAEQLMPTRRCADHTQAMMDLGALVCVRRHPRCAECPVRTDCVAYRSGRQHALPAPRARKALPVRETMMVMARTSNGDVLLERRPPVGVWGGLLSFPEVRDEQACAALCERVFGAAPEKMIRWPVVRQTFTHFRLDITPVEVIIDHGGRIISDDTRWVWYNAASPQGGLAAPVKQLIERLITTHEGVTDGPHSAVRKAG
ncbi:MAG: A/G-specific adenine glycosylase [Gammaproteobacteria bacterium]